MAFAIAAIGLAVVFQAFSIGLETVDRVDERMNALRFAQSKLASLGHDIVIREGLTVGDPEDGFSWVVEVTPQTVDIEGPRAVASARIGACGRSCERGRRRQSAPRRASND